MFIKSPSSGPAQCSKGIGKAVEGQNHVQVDEWADGAVALLISFPRTRVVQENIAVDFREVDFRGAEAGAFKIDNAGHLIVDRQYIGRPEIHMDEARPIRRR